MSPLATLSEHDSKQKLIAAGLIVAPETLAGTPAEAAAAATELGFPVVLKACGTKIAHKTERGLIRLNLDNAAAVEAAATELLDRLTPDDGDDTALLVAAMVNGNREFIVGVSTDPSFGSTIMIGVGGIFTEVVADVAFRLLPLNRHDPFEMIDDLVSQQLFGAFRGEPAVDRRALADTILAVARCAEADPTIEAIDVNPLVIVDGLPVAVDALIVTQ